MSSNPEVFPGVSYVMPVLNEVGYIESAVHSILAQEYPGQTEIVLALGPSTDGTNELVASLAEGDRRIRTVHNPRSAIPVGLNLAIRSCVHPVIARVDAHTELPAGYTKRAVETLLRVPADNVGGIMSAAGSPGVQAAIARAYNSRIGLGGGAYHSSDVAGGPAESAYLGVMRASALADIGGFDESLLRAEDWEMNHRLRQSGHLVWLDPTLLVTYWPRSSWQALSRQFFATGIWRGELVRRFKGRHPLRFFAPPLLTTAALTSIVVVPLGILLGGWLALAAAFFVAVDLAYLTVVTGAAALSPGSLLDRARFGGALVIMHFAWGAGFLRGVTRGGRQSLDRSRHG